MLAVEPVVDVAGGGGSASSSSTVRDSSRSSPSSSSSSSSSSSPPPRRTGRSSVRRTLFSSSTIVSRRAFNSAGDRSSFRSRRTWRVSSWMRRSPVLVSSTGPPVPRTIWYAPANVSQSVQFSLTATATFCGVTVLGLPVTSTIWIAIAVALQRSQLAYATAVFVWSTTSPATSLIEKANEKSDEPLFVLIATAELSFERLRPPSSSSSARAKSGRAKPVASARTSARRNSASRRQEPLMGSPLWLSSWSVPVLWSSEPSWSREPSQWWSGWSSSCLQALSSSPARCPSS